MEENKRSSSTITKKTNNSLDQNKQFDSKSLRSNTSKSDLDVKSATQEVSEILTSLSETAKKYDNPHKPKNWSLLPIKIEETSMSHFASSSPTDSLSSSSEDDDEESEAESSEIDEETSSNLRVHCMGEITLIEKQFTDLKEMLYKERDMQITNKLAEVKSETATEYLQQLELLQQQKKIKLEIAEILRNLRISSLDVQLKAEKMANSQHLSNEKKIIMGKMESELEDKIRCLEEDRDNVDTEYWTHSTRVAGFAVADDRVHKGKRRKKDEHQSSGYGSQKRKKKPVTVSGPYIVYMLKDSDVVDDWTAIRKAVTVSHRRAAVKRSNFVKKRNPHFCRYEDGKFHCGGKIFMKGQHIMIKKLIHSEAKFIGTIENLSSTQICIRQNNGKKSKLHVHQLQRGKYSIHHR